jgi:hypothetical protein
LAATNAECGSHLKATIVWDTISDKALQEHSVSDYCAGALRALRAACASPGGKQFVQSQVQEVRCRLDGNGEMSLNAGQLTWSVNFELGDLETVAGRALSGLTPADAPGSEGK